MKVRNALFVGLMAIVASQGTVARAHGGGGIAGLFSSSAASYAFLLSTIIHEDGYREGRRDRRFKEEAKIKELREMATNYLINGAASSNILSDQVMIEFQKKMLEKDSQSANLSNDELVNFFLSTLNEVAPQN